MDENSRFRNFNGTVQYQRKKTWHQAMNFIPTLKRLITGEGTVELQISTPYQPGNTFVGIIQEPLLCHPQKLHAAILRAIPDLGGLIISLRKEQLTEYWDAEIHRYHQTYRQIHGYTNATVRATRMYGWQPCGAFVVNEHLTVDGETLEPIPPEASTVKLLPNAKLPCPTTTELDDSAARNLFDVLKRLLPRETYLTSVVLGGVAVMAANYKEVKKTYHHVPIPILLGRPNTCKSLLAKVVASLLGGLHRSALFHQMTFAKLSELLSGSLFFVLNDPRETRILLELITRTFEDGKTSNCLGDSEPNTLPLITANTDVMGKLLSGGGRAASRVAILWLQEEAPVLLDPSLDDALDNAGKSIVALINAHPGDSMQEVAAKAKEMSQLFEGEAKNRLSHSYALLGVCAEKFVHAAKIDVSADMLWRHITDYIIPKALAHQVPTEPKYDSIMISLLAEAIGCFTKEELAAHFCLYSYNFMNGDKEGLAIRQRRFTATIKERTTQISFSEEKLRKEFESFGGRRVNIRMVKGKSAVATWLLPREVIPLEIWNAQPLDLRKDVDLESITEISLNTDLRKDLDMESVTEITQNTDLRKDLDMESVTEITQNTDADQTQTTICDVALIPTDSNQACNDTAATTPVRAVSKKMRTNDLQQTRFHDTTPVRAVGVTSSTPKPVQGKRTFSSRIGKGLNFSQIQPAPTQVELDSTLQTACKKLKAMPKKDRKDRRPKKGIK